MVGALNGNRTEATVLVGLEWVSGTNRKTLPWLEIISKLARHHAVVLKRVKRGYHETVIQELRLKI